MQNDHQIQTNKQGPCIQCRNLIIISWLQGCHHVLQAAIAKEDSPVTSHKKLLCHL